MASRPGQPSEPDAGDARAFDPETPRRTIPAIERTGASVLRPDDLLSFRASWTGLSIEASGRRGEALVAGPKGGTLTIGFPFQHLTESARPAEDGPPLPPPVPARAAGPSRLVFAVPAGERIDYSVAGLLEAMGRLEMVVAPAAAGPAATPRPFGSTTVPAGQRSPLIDFLVDGKTPRVGARTGPDSRDGKADTRDFLGARHVALVAGRLAASGALSPVNLDELVVPPRVRPPKLPVVRAPKPGETAIEAPFRLLLSPSRRSGWVHSPLPAATGAGVTRVELWHTRLATRRRTGETDWLDEAPDRERTLRAIWTRDRDRTQPGTREDIADGSLTPRQRGLIVDQTAGSPRAPNVTPTPIQVRRLALSSLGAFLDTHVQWPWRSYPRDFGPLESWDHVAPMGRDQFVRVVTPGFLYPLGHAAYLVEITYRKVVGTTNPVAGLFKRRFLVLGDANRAYTNRDLPFVAANLGPMRTPDLRPPESDDLFVPRPMGTSGTDADSALRWQVAALDQDGRPVSLRMPMVWVRALTKVSKAQVDALYEPLKTVPADGQSIAFAPAQAAGDGGAEGQASAEALSLVFAGTSLTQTGVVPQLDRAKVAVPAMKRLTPQAPPVEVRYADIYRTHGFKPANKGQVYLALTTASQLAFGSSDRSGGFIQPDVAVEALARGAGLVADMDKAALGEFDPKTLFAGGFPKLFGLIDLWEIVGDTLLDLAPKFLTDELDKVTALLRDLERLHELVQDGSELAQKAADTGAHDMVVAVQSAVTPVVSRFKQLLDPSADLEETAHLLGESLKELRAALKDLRAAVPDVPLGPSARAVLDRLIAAVGTALDIHEDVTDAVEKVVDAIKLLRDGIDPGGKELRARLEWKPTLTPWPASDPIFVVDQGGGKKATLSLSVETRAAAGKPPVADIAAELADFALDLVPGARLMRVRFDRLAFRTSISRKSEIDVVFGGIEFLGVLSFINVLADIIPLDGFSDPPFVDVSAEGVSAGFTLALPNLAIGVFSLSNLAIAADARIPFLGSEALSVGFAFCTRERPFTLAVAILGGGGFVGIRLNPKGLMLLEAAFEFGAVVALDFGVASGSVSAVAGIYFRMEGPDVSLTGYFRVRGEVDVLGLISASIELYMALTYESATGKMVGEASITVSVEVLFFSTSVTIRTQRTFAGSNGDPTAEQMLLPGDLKTSSPGWDGRSAIWEDYCAAFRPAKQEG